MADGLTPKKAMKILEDVLDEHIKSGIPDLNLLKSGLETALVQNNISAVDLSDEFIEKVAGIYTQTAPERLKDLLSLLSVIIGISPGNPAVEKVVEKIFGDLSRSESREEVQRAIESISLKGFDDGILSVVENFFNGSDGEKTRLALKYSSQGLIRTEFLDSIHWSSVSTSDSERILSGYISNLSPENALRAILPVYEKATIGISMRIAVLNIIGKVDRERLAAELDDFPYSDLKNDNDIAEMIRLLDSVGNYQKALEIINKRLSVDQNNKDLLRLKADLLLKSGASMEGYEIIKQLIKEGNASQDLLRTSLDIAFSQKLFDEFLDLLKTDPDVSKEKKYSLMKIEVELQKSMFSEALRDINEGLARNPVDDDLLKMKFKTQIKLNSSSEAFNTALEILKSDPASLEAIQYAINSLYARGEFSQVLSYVEKNAQVKQQNMNLVLASLMQLGKVREAMILLNEKPSLAASPEFLDSVFFTVRDEEILKELESFALLHKDHSGGLRMVNARLRGLPVNFDLIDYEFLEKYAAPSILYIAAWWRIYRGGEIPDFISQFTSKPQFRGVKATIDLFIQARNGKSADEIIDSAAYLYPISEAFISDGKLDRAERELLRTVRDEKDPFYLYLVSTIDFYRGDYASARKYIEAALDRLLNCNFLLIGIQVAMAYGDSKKIREYGEKLIGLGSMEGLNLGGLYGYVVRNKMWKQAAEFVSVVEAELPTNPWLFRLRRDVFRSENSTAKALEQSLLLFRTRQFNRNDIDIHIEMLRKAGRSSEVVQFLQDLETENKSPEIELILASQLYDEGKFAAALKNFEEAVKMGADPYSIPKYVDTLIETGNLAAAQEMVSKTGNELLQLKIYRKTSNIPAAIDMLNRINFKRPEDDEILRYAVSALWYNRDVRDLIVSIYSREGFVWLGKIIARKTFESGDTKLALDIARNMNRNEPSDLEVVRLYADMLVKSGERTGAIELILRSMRHCKDTSACLDLINVLLRLYYEDRDYEAIIKFYEANPKYVDENSLQYVIRSYIETENFDMAEKIMSRYEGTLLGKETHSELMEDLRTKKEFMQTLLYVSRLLKVEYKAKRKFDKKEAFYKADIPIERIEDVFAFLDSREFYFDINEEKYEVLSRDVIQKAVKSYPLGSIKDLTIAVIFNNLDRRDPIIARNLYIYIQDQLDIARHPQTKNDVLLRLLKRAIKNNIKEEPLTIAYYLQIGISEALDVITLMNYISKMNEESDI